VEEFHLFYERKEKGSGFSFPCDKDGNVITTHLFPEAQDSLAQCIAHPEQFLSPVVHDYSRDIRHCAVGECNHCNGYIALQGFTNTCDCGAEYNSAGQELAPRECWGEETGEHPADIGRIS
jgi:hypothetical protein